MKINNGFYLYNKIYLWYGLTAVVLMQPCQEDAVCFYAKAKALHLAFRK